MLVAEAIPETPGPQLKQDPRPPIDPVRKNYPAIEQWWTGTTGKKFTPKFAASASAEVEAEPFERNNPAARFLILIFSISIGNMIPRTLADWLIW